MLKELRENLLSIIRSYNFNLMTNATKDRIYEEIYGLFKENNINFSFDIVFNIETRECLIEPLDETSRLILEALEEPTEE